MGGFTTTKKLEKRKRIGKMDNGGDYCEGTLRGGKKKQKKKKKELNFYFYFYFFQKINLKPCISFNSFKSY